MKKLFLMALSATMLVSCYTQSELDEHKETYELLAQQADSRADAAIAAANVTIDELSAALEVAGQTVFQLEATVVEANAEIAALNAQNIEKGTEIDLLNGIIADAEDKIADLEAENAELAATIEELNDKISSLENLVQNLRDSQVVTVVEVTEVIETIVETVETIVEVEVQVPGETVTVTNTVEVSTGISQEDLNAAVQTVQDALDAANAAYATLAADNSANIESIVSLQQSIVDLSGEIATLEAAELVDDSVIVGLQTQVTTLEGYVAELTASLDTANADLAAANASIADLNAQIAAIIPEDGISQADLDAANAAAAAIQAELDAIVVEDGVSQSDVDAVQALLDAANVTIADLEAQLAAANATIDELSDVDRWELGDPNSVPGPWNYNPSTIDDAIWNAGSFDNGGNGDVAVSRSRTVTTTTEYVLAYDGATDVTQPPAEVSTETETDNKTITDSFVPEIIPAESTEFASFDFAGSADGTYTQTRIEADGTEDGTEVTRTIVIETQSGVGTFTESSITDYTHYTSNGGNDDGDTLDSGTTVTSTRSVRIDGDLQPDLFTSSIVSYSVTDDQTELTFDAKDLDEDGDVDVDDAIAAGYSFTINPGLFGGEAAEAFLNETSLSGFDSAFLYDDVAQATTAVEAFILTHYNNN